MNMKKCVLILCSLSYFSQIDAGWRDQWVWFKSLFSGFSIKKPIITRQKMVIGGGVGALAVAGAAWWWLKSPKKPKTQDPGETLGRNQNKPSSKPKDVVNTSNQPIPGQPSPLIISQPEEINDGDAVFIDFSENFLYEQYTNIFGIIRKIEKDFKVETILNIKHHEKLIQTHDAKYKKVTLKSVNNNFKDIDQYGYVFVNEKENDQKVILIGKYISHNDNKVTVLSGSLFYNIKLKNREYELSDVFVPIVEKEKIQVVNSDVNEKELRKKADENAKKLAQVESKLETAKRKKLKLESELETEKIFTSSKETKNIIKQTNELTNFEKLLTQYENNKSENNKTQLTEEFEKLNPTISENSKQIWENLTVRYNNAINVGFRVSGI